MLFATVGLSHDEGTVARACGITVYGCQMQDLVTGARSLGLNAALLRVLDGQGAVVALSHQVPFVAMIDVATLHNVLPMLQWHFVVPLALVQDEVVFHDPVAGPDRRAKLDDFVGAWAMAGYGGVRVWTP